MNIARKLPFAAVVAAAMAFAACQSTEEIAYFSDAARDSAVSIGGRFTSGIQANDLLEIYVESETPQATIPFNQQTNKVAVVDGAVMNPGNNAVEGYLVNSEGKITFPVLGEVEVLGKSHEELAADLQRQLREQGHVSDAVVTVKLLNFKVSVLGDVAHPGMVQATGERFTVFEALSMVGDLTIFGQRRNVTVVREENGVRTIGELDLSSKDIFSSPYYYLHQNDVVYVEPNMKKKKTAMRDPMMMTYISAGLSVVSTLSSVFYYIILSRYYNNRTN
ncbi:MAG: polysaccharide biosynthesis/export family protein [Bacteroidales bacterium]|nr:polysaccharide biosynthesis/export family protein [Bacteroidales bacterium]